MILLLNTASFDAIEIELRDKDRIIARKQLAAAHTQAEKLLPAVEALCQKNKVSLKDIKRIKVENRGAGFTSLRIGVATANALAYALGAPVEPLSGKALQKKGIQVVSPEYAKPPSVTIKKNK